MPDSDTTTSAGQWQKMVDPYQTQPHTITEDARARNVLVGDLEYLEYAIADYVARLGEHWTGKPYMGKFGPNIAGLPVAVANMAMTVIRKNLEPARPPGITEEEVEAAARAMFERGSSGRVRWERVSERTRDEHRNDARAALQAAARIRASTAVNDPSDAGGAEPGSLSDGTV
jgi:N-methylhydantoinase A/oxoprolinase/acetone carboxylase beta subunit